MANFLAGQVPTAAELSLATRAGEVVGRARRITDSSASTSTTRVAVLELDDVPLTGGRVYEIASPNLNIDGGTANDDYVVDILYTTDGSTPTTSSALLPGSSCEIIQPDAARNITAHISTTYTPATDETLSLLLCLRHGSGTSSAVIRADGTFRHIEMLVIDRGVDPGDTGVDL